MAQSQSGPMFINIPPPSSNPDTPSDMPGTPTSTTTSLSAISTTAIKDGHRGHAHPLQHFGGRGHQHNPSTNSLEAERADRISRLAGLERVSTLRPGAPNAAGGNQQTTPTSTGFPAHAGGGAPAYFDSNGQPTAANKMSTVGSASATGSIGGRTTTEGGDDNNSEMGGTSTEVDDDFMSNPSNYRGHMDIDSVTGAIDQDEVMTNRSVGGYEDQDPMSDNDNASLVGFGEGANSTVSGPIYQRRPLPGGFQQQQSAGAGAWGLERSSSGLSDAAILRSARAAEYRDSQHHSASNSNSNNQHQHHHSHTHSEDTTSQNQIPVLPGQPQTSALREGVGGPASRESAAERLIRERLDGGESEVGASALRSPQRGSNDKLGQFYFEK